MVWLEEVRDEDDTIIAQDVIVVLFDDDQTHVTFDNTWEEGMPVYDSSFTPPVCTVLRNPSDPMLQSPHRSRTRCSSSSVRMARYPVSSTPILAASLACRARSLSRERFSKI